MPLRLTLELIPNGDESRKKTVGTLDIENTGDHPQHPYLANYKYHMTGPVHESGIDDWHSGTIRDVVRSRGYWAHAKDVLNAVDCEAEPQTNEEQ